MMKELIVEYAERQSNPRFISMALHTHLANHTCRSNTTMGLGSAICVWARHLPR